MDLLTVPAAPVVTSDEAIGPNQYRFVATHAWRLGTFFAAGQVHAYLVEHVLTQWIPACPERDWVLDHRITGEVRWLSGSERVACEAGFDPCDGVPVGRFRAPFGDFHAEQQGRVPGRRMQSWHTPSSEFLAGLPLDPVTLGRRLADDHPPSRYSGPFTAAAGTLRTCLVPAALRTSLYRALCLLPAVSLETNALDLDGRRCLALVHDDGPTRTELFIDPADGQYAGERDTLRRASRCGLNPGTVINSTAVRTGVVGECGTLPG
jgi:hypothetical protein